MSEELLCYACLHPKMQPAHCVNCGRSEFIPKPPTRAEFVAEAMRLADAMAHTARRVGGSHGPTEYADCYGKFEAARAALLAHLEQRDS